MKKTVLTLFIVSLLAAPGLVNAQATSTTTRTRTSTAVTETAAPAASPSPVAVTTTPAVTSTSSLSATTKGGLPVSGNFGATFSLIIVGLALLSVGAYSFGHRR